MTVLPAPPRLPAALPAAPAACAAPSTRRLARDLRRAIGVLFVLASPSGCAAAHAPPAPDYRAPGAWLALPGAAPPGLARSTPPGVAPVAEDAAAADVFFIHPTTVLASASGNAPASGGGRFDRAVLANQASAFNACCRIFAPRYRQATLGTLGDADHAADDRAWADVDAAFSAFLARIGDRPFIVAGHSQGASLGLRLVEDRIAGSPLAARLVAAYLPGAFVPADTAAATGLPACAGPDATGCIVSWNTSDGSVRGAEMLLLHATYRVRGGWRKANGEPALCVDPLSWRVGGASPAAADRGSLRLSFPARDGAVVLPATVPALTGSACRPDGALVVHVGPRAPAGFHDLLAWLTGSEHIEDYNLFWTSIRANAAARVAAWTRTH